MSISRQTLAKFIKPGQTTFIETGTRWGDTVIKAVELGAVEAISCEIDELFFALAKMHVSDAVPKDMDRVLLERSDSVSFLRKLKRRGPKTVFLDAHKERYSPLLDELLALNEWGTEKPDVILIDDLRLFGDWHIDRSQLVRHLGTMGYAVGYTDGTAPKDIMVGTKR